MFRVTLSKVRIEEVGFSVWANVFEALAHAGELSDEMGLEDFETVKLARHPQTGQLVSITVTKEVESGT